MKYLFWIISFLIFSFCGFLVAKWYYTPLPDVKSTEINMALEKVKNAFKIIAVEGEISEIVDHKEYWGYDIFPLRKQMLIRVHGHLSVGYNLDNVHWTLNEKDKTLYIGPFPKPEILSLDHDVDYYDIKEGLFNAFSTADYNKIQDKIKAVLKDPQYSSPLMERAEERRDSLIKTFDDFLSIYNWHIQLAIPAQTDSLD